MNDKDPKCVWVSNLPLNITKQELEDKFAVYGKIESIDLPDRRAYAFIHYVDENSAAKAISDLDQKDFKGKKLSLNLYKE